MSQLSSVQLLLPQSLRHVATTAIGNPTISSRKRKRGESVSAEHLRKPFVIRARPSSAYDKPYTLTPLHLIPRSRLPLSLLDPVADASALPNTRLFSAHIELLERDNALKNQYGSVPVVLVARLEADQSFYAIERVEAGIYSLCKLKSWVKVRDLEALSQPAETANHARSHVAAAKQQDGEWWQQAVLDVYPIFDTTSRPAEYARISMVRPAPTPGPAEAPLLLANEEPTQIGSPHRTSDPRIGDTPEPAELQVSAQTVFENLITQYLDALYLSRASLAYFAKGPLSRARAAFTTGQDSSMRLHELTAFLRSMLLSTSSMDKKYRERVPAIVRTIPAAASSDDEHHSVVMPAGLKKGKKRKLKPNKDGIFPSEEEYVKRWWTTGNPPSAKDRTEVTGEVLIKRSVAELRIRETLAQLIVILETLALEASPSYQPSKPEDTPVDLESQVTVDCEDASMKKKKPRKPQDLGLLIDLLVDKLCIWQSVEQDDSAAVIHETSSVAGAKGSESTAGKTGSSDRLNGFCVEVIIPFYIARLPEQAKAINKKLGGPTAPSSAKSASTIEKTSSKPGEPQARHPPTKRSRRSLARISTDTAAQPTDRPPSLARCATDSLVVPDLKREASETPLTAIPIKLDQKGSLSRSSSSTFKRFSQREVDLSAMAAANEAKMRKRANIEEELQSAISALKKPNRGLAAREYVESTDQRRKRPSMSRKVSNSVQVTATPKRPKRTKDAVDATSVRKIAPLATQPPPSWSNPLVSSSAVRPAIPASAPAQRPPPPSTAVAETPSRGSAKFISFAAATPAFKLPASAAQKPARDVEDGDVRLGAALQRTPSKARWGAEADAAVCATPVKVGSGRAAGNGFRRAAFVARCGGGEEEGGGDIYDALGWDDDGDGLG